MYLEPCAMCLGTALQLCGTEVSLSCPDIGSLEPRKIIDKQPTVLLCTQSSPVQLWEVSRNRCISTSRRPCGHQGRGIQHLSDSS